MQQIIGSALVMCTMECVGYDLPNKTLRSNQPFCICLDGEKGAISHNNECRLLTEVQKHVEYQLHVKLSCPSVCMILGLLLYEEVTVLQTAKAGSTVHIPSKTWSLNAVYSCKSSFYL